MSQLSILSDSPFKIATSDDYTRYSRIADMQPYSWSGRAQTVVYTHRLLAHHLLSNIRKQIEQIPYAKTHSFAPIS